MVSTTVHSLEFESRLEPPTKGTLRGGSLTYCEHKSQYFNYIINHNLMSRDTEGVMRANMSLVEKQAELLRTYLDTHGLDHDTALQRDMIARYS